MTDIIQDHRNSTRAAFISQWMRTTPDIVDNMFGAITYFAIPKSCLKNVGLFLLIRDEQEASISSTPIEVVAKAMSPQGKYNKV